MSQQFRNDVLTKMIDNLSKEQLSMLDICLTELLTMYDVELKTTALVQYDGYNEHMMKIFIASMRLEGRSEKTLEQYIMAMNSLLNDVPKRICDITTNDIRYHLSTYQATRKCQNTTIANKRSYLSAIYKWFYQEEYIKSNPMHNIKPIKVQSKVKQVFSDEEVERIKNACNDDREIALIEFMLSSACRVSEIASIKLDDVNFAKSECIVLGKGNKQRKVYMSEKTMYYLKKYVYGRTDNEEWLFLNQYGAQLSKTTIENLVKRIGKRAGLEGVTPHKFRRTFATNALDHGMPLQSVQRILGHSNINTTISKYCNISDLSIKDDYRRAVV